MVDDDDDDDGGWQQSVLCCQEEQRGESGWKMEQCYLYIMQTVRPFEPAFRQRADAAQICGVSIEEAGITAGDVVEAVTGASIDKAVAVVHYYSRD